MKKEQDSRQIRSATILREQLKLQNNIKCDSSHNKFAIMHPEQLKHLSKDNHVSMKIRSATVARAAETPEQRHSCLQEDQVHHRIARAAETPIQHVARLLGLRKMRNVAITLK
ncbi:hypothetical protein TNCT_32321 [Trichonephila clavata]|uniref:Uncharacterized protein n=1 Tax=Trichonephila clavata TaxID=2740835 RepID=A0A8X6M3F2_TRICU|nr:hypothetical protein TNCT_32321 [Trichonephila clavata]